jgi:hypothetical protein
VKLFSLLLRLIAGKMHLCSLALVLALGLAAAASLEVGAPEWRTWKLAHGNKRTFGQG